MQIKITFNTKNVEEKPVEFTKDRTPVARVADEE